MDNTNILTFCVIAILTVAIVPFLKNAYTSLLLSIEADKREMLQDVINTAVVAAEQIYKSQRGDEKKMYALHIVQQWLDAHKIAIDAGVIEAALEQAVFENFGHFENFGQASPLG